MSTQSPKPTMATVSKVPKGLTAFEERMKSTGMEINITHMPCTIHALMKRTKLPLISSKRASPLRSWARQARKIKSQPLKLTYSPSSVGYRFDPFRSSAGISCSCGIELGVQMLSTDHLYDVSSTI